MEITHKHLVDRATIWLKREVNCGVVAAEMRSATCSGEIPDVFGFRANKISILIECKATRSDFLRDRQKPFRVEPALGVGLYRFYLCPIKLIAPEEIPEKWGLLYLEENNSITRIVGGPKGNIWGQENQYHFTERNIDAEFDILYSAARRLSKVG